MTGLTASLSYSYLNYSKNMVDTYITELFLKCSDAPRMFNSVKLMVRFCLTRIHLHIHVPEKKCYQVT